MRSSLASLSSEQGQGWRGRRLSPPVHGVRERRAWLARGARGDELEARA
jgi:hypothetical protein